MRLAEWVDDWDSARWAAAATMALALLVMVVVTPANAAEPPNGIDFDSAGDQDLPEPSGDTPARPSALPQGDCAGGEVYDDGVAENGYSGTPGLVSDFNAVMLFTPTSYPARYDTICVALVSLGGPTHEFTIKVWDDDGPGGVPGTPLLETETLTVDDLPVGLPCKMYEVDISDHDLTIPDGSVYIGVRWNPMDFPSRYVCADESAATPLRLSYVNFHNPDQWDTTESQFPGYKALLMRSVQDLTPPETTITSGPADGSTITEKIATFGFGATETSTFECSVDGAVFGPCSGPGDTHTTEELADGTHTFEVRATDEVANTDPTPAMRTFTVAIPPPPTTTTTTSTTLPPTTSTTSTPTTTTVPGETDFFVDDDGHVFEEDINAIAAEGITFGCNPPANDWYCPDETFERGHAAAFLSRALSVPSSEGDFFVDDDNSVFEDDINAIAEAGITVGCNPPANDEYCPNEIFLRGQAAAFVRRALLIPASDRDFFVDDEDSIFEDDINAIAEAGITRGCNPPVNDRYCPDRDPFTRGQAAAFMRRALLR